MKRAPGVLKKMQNTHVVDDSKTRYEYVGYALCTTGARRCTSLKLISKDQKENITFTMDDVRGDFLGPPHGTTPAAVIANKN